MRSGRPIGWEMYNAAQAAVHGQDVHNSASAKVYQYAFSNRGKRSSAPALPPGDPKLAHRCEPDALIGDVEALGSDFFQ